MLNGKLSIDVLSMDTSMGYDRLLKVPAFWTWSRLRSDIFVQYLCWGFPEIRLNFSGRIQGTTRFHKLWFNLWGVRQKTALRIKSEWMYPNVHHEPPRTPKMTPRGLNSPRQARITGQGAMLRRFWSCFKALRGAPGTHLGSFFAS